MVYDRGSTGSKSYPHKPLLPLVSEWLLSLPPLPYAPLSPARVAVATSPHTETPKVIGKQL